MYVKGGMAIKHVELFVKHTEKSSCNAETEQYRHCKGERLVYINNLTEAALVGCLM